VVVKECGIKHYICRKDTALPAIQFFQRDISTYTFGLIFLKFSE